MRRLLTWHYTQHTSQSAKPNVQLSYFNIPPIHTTHALHNSLTRTSHSHTPFSHCTQHSPHSAHAYTPHATLSTQHTQHSYTSHNTPHSRTTLATKHSHTQHNTLSHHTSGPFMVWKHALGYSSVAAFDTDLRCISSADVPSRNSSATGHHTLKDDKAIFAPNKSMFARAAALTKIPRMNNLKVLGWRVHIHRPLSPIPTPHHTTQHHTTQIHHTTPHHTTPHHTTPHHTTPHHTTPHHTTSRFLTPHFCI